MWAKRPRKFNYIELFNEIVIIISSACSTEYIGLNKHPIDFFLIGLWGTMILVNLFMVFRVIGNIVRLFALKFYNLFKGKQK